MRVDKGMKAPLASESLRVQESELRKYCEANQLEILQAIREVGNGKDFNRPEMGSLIT